MSVDDTRGQGPDVVRAPRKHVRRYHLRYPWVNLVASTSVSLSVGMKNEEIKGSYENNILNLLLFLSIMEGSLVIHFIFPSYSFYITCFSYILKEPSVLTVNHLHIQFLTVCFSFRKNRWFTRPTAIRYQLLTFCFSTLLSLPLATHYFIIFLFNFLSTNHEHREWEGWQGKRSTMEVKCKKKRRSSLTVHGRSLRYQLFIIYAALIIYSSHISAHSFASRTGRV